MKVVHVTTMDFGGAGMAVIRIHEALLNQGVDSKILVLTKITNTPGVISYLPKKSNKYIQGILSRIENVRRRLWELRNPIARWVRKSNILNDCFFTLSSTSYRVEKHPLIKNADIVHLHWIQNFVNYPTFFSTVEKPCVWTFHDENIGLGGFHYIRDYEKFYKKHRKLEDFLRNIKQNSYLLKSDVRLIPLSKIMNDFIIKVPYCSHWKKTIVHNPVNTSVFVLHEKKECRISLGLPLDKKVILFVAYEISDDRKGLDKLIRSLKNLNRNDILLCCVGGNQNMHSIDIPHTLLGHIHDESQLSRVYSAADLFVLASDQEAFGQTLLESISCGTPVVSFPCGISEELINKNNGIRCNDFSIEEMARCIDIALNTTYDIRVMRDDVIKRFSPEHIAQQYIAIYQNMLK